MISRSISLALLLTLTGCASAKEEPGEALPPPSAVKAAGKAMRTTSGYIHPSDPPGTWRAGRPHHRAIEPCSDWQPGGPPITEDYGKDPRGPKMVYMSVTQREMPGAETVRASALTADFGPPHRATRSVMIGNSAPLGPHWTWTLKGKPGALFIAEARPDGGVRYHFAEVGGIVGGGNSAGFMSECLIERYGTPGWSFDPPPRRW